MNNFLFQSGTKFRFGGGCVKEYLSSYLTAFGPNVLLITEEADSHSGAAAEVRDILRRGGKHTAECSAGPFCPRYEQVQQAARLCREKRVDLILGVGGSAVLDGCKAISLAAVCRGDLWENFGELQGVVDVPPLPVGFVASHLEAGAISGAAGVIHQNQCIWRDYPPCDPVFALLDPAYTHAFSRRALISQGFTALGGALEEYLPPAEGMGVSRELLEALLQGMVRDLRALCKAPGDESARSNLMWRCALWGSRFFQLGRRFAFPALPVREAAILSASDWGEYAGALSVLLLARFRREAEQDSAVLAQLARRVWKAADREASGQNAAQAGIRAFTAFLQELELPTEYTELGTAHQEKLAEQMTSGEGHALLPDLTKRRDGHACVS